VWGGGEYRYSAHVPNLTPDTSLAFARRSPGNRQETSDRAARISTEIRSHSSQRLSGIPASSYVLGNFMPRPTCDCTQTYGNWFLSSFSPFFFSFSLSSSFSLPSFFLFSLLLSLQSLLLLLLFLFSFFLSYFSLAYFFLFLPLLLFLLCLRLLFHILLTFLVLLLFLVLRSHFPPPPPISYAAAPPPPLLPQFFSFFCFF
jgi:hypothetical protein